MFKDMPKKMFGFKTTMLDKGLIVGSIAVLILGSWDFVFQKTMTPELRPSINMNLPAMDEIPQEDLFLSSAELASYEMSSVSEQVTDQMVAPPVAGPAHGSKLHVVYKRRYVTSKDVTIDWLYYKNASYGECVRIRAQAKNPNASCQIYFRYHFYSKRVPRIHHAQFASTSANSSISSQGETLLTSIPDLCFIYKPGSAWLEVRSILWSARIQVEFIRDDIPWCKYIQYTRADCSGGGFFWDVTISKCEVNPRLHETFAWNQVEFGETFKASYLIKDFGPINFTHSAWANIDPTTGFPVNLHLV